MARLVPAAAQEVMFDKNDMERTITFVMNMETVIRRVLMTEEADYNHWTDVTDQGVDYHIRYPENYENALTKEIDDVVVSATIISVDPYDEEDQEMVVTMPHTGIGEY